MNKAKIGKFLNKLFSILDNQQFSDIICWDYAGQNLVIKDQVRLEKEIIPLHFSLKKFTSFVRQLHLYNFHKKKCSGHELIFYNCCFTRGNRDLAAEIVRKRKTKAQALLESQTKNSQKSMDLQKSTDNVQAHSSPVGYQDCFRSYNSLQIINEPLQENRFNNQEDPYDFLCFL